MSEALILHIETATDICSVALSQGEQLLALRESGAERNHATLLSTYIRECMNKAGKAFNELDGVAVSKGPGSYTGLRIGVSTASNGPMWPSSLKADLNWSGRLTIGRSYVASIVPYFPA